MFGQDRRGGWGPIWTQVGLAQVGDGPFLLTPQQYIYHHYPSVCTCKYKEMFDA